MYSVHVDKLKLYRDYQYERAKVYFNKEKGIKPYSTDPYLSTYKFTNVKRYLDRQSKFLIDNVCNSSELSLVDKLANCFLFRCFNHEEGIVYLKEYPVKFTEMTESDLVDWNDYESSVESSNRYQSNAYFLSHIRKASYAATDYKFNKQTSLVAWVHGLLGEFKEITAVIDDPTKVLGMLYEINSIGNFMAYQILIDFSYCEEVPFDDNCLVISGPGCDNGIIWFLLDDHKQFELSDPNYPEVIWLDYRAAWNRVVELNPVLAESDSPCEDFIWWLEGNIDSLMKENGIEWDTSEFLHFLPNHQQVWNKMDIENSFCEFNKLCKLVYGHSFRYRYYR